MEVGTVVTSIAEQKKSANILMCRQEIMQESKIGKKRGGETEGQHSKKERSRRWYHERGKREVCLMPRNPKSPTE